MKITDHNDRDYEVLIREIFHVLCENTFSEHAGLVLHKYPLQIRHDTYSKSG